MLGSVWIVFVHHLLVTIVHHSQQPTVPAVAQDGCLECHRAVADRQSLQALQVKPQTHVIRPRFSMNLGTADATWTADAEDRAADNSARADGTAGYRFAFLRVFFLGMAAARCSFALSSSSFASASRLPMPRTAARAASCSFRGRDFPCSQL